MSACDSESESGPEFNDQSLINEIGLSWTEKDRLDFLRFKFQFRVVFI